MSNQMQLKIAQQSLEALQQLGAQSVDVAVGFWRRVPGYPADSPDGWERPKEPGWFQQRLGLSPSGALAQVPRLALCNTPRQSDDDNQHGGCVYIRPARFGGDHPVLLLDDANQRTATAISAKYMGCMIETSPGNYQILLRGDRATGEPERLIVQRWLSRQVGSDRGSVSAEHYFRWPGFANRKPWRNVGATKPQWVRIVATPRVDGELVPVDRILALASTNPSPANEPAATAVSLAPRLSFPERAPMLPSATTHEPKRDSAGIDTTTSGREFGYVLSLLYYRRWTVERVISKLMSQPSTQAAQGIHVESYCKRTVMRADAEITAGNYPGKYPNRRHR
jgi:hypothetical protein